MENNENLSDGAQQADMVSNENADTKFGADQGETNMVKLVNGKLTPIGDTDDDVADDQLLNRYSDDDERAFNGDQQSGLTYENADAGIRADDAQEGVDMKQLPDNPQAEAELTGNPDAGDVVNTGLPSEARPGKSDEVTPTGFFSAGSTVGSYSTTAYPSADMIPPTPGTPDPMQPVPGIPETPPYNPMPGPEIPELPGTPSPDKPEIEDPTQPDRSHEVNSAQTTARHRVATTNFLTYTASAAGLADELDTESSTNSPGNAVAGNQYEGMTAGPNDEGMDEKPDTGNSAHPYDVNAKDADEYQPGERPEEGEEARQLPRELMDESSVTAQDMISGPDRSDQKSTEGLDRKYNDPEAARDIAS